MLLLSMIVRGVRTLWLPLLAIVASFHAADAQGAPRRGMALSESAACLTVEQCREKFVALKSTGTIGGYYYVSKYSTKGCFLKRNNVYFGTGGTVAAMSIGFLPGIQKRIWCDADGIDQEIALAEAEAEDELLLIDVTGKPTASKPLIELPLPVMRPTSKPFASQSPEQPTATPVTESPSKQPINQSTATKEPVIATISQPPDSVEVLPNITSSTMPVPNPTLPSEETTTLDMSTSLAPVQIMAGFPTRRPTSMPIASKSFHQPTITPVANVLTASPSNRPIANAVQPAGQPATNKEPTPTSATQALDSEALQNMTSAMSVPDQIQPTAATATATKATTTTPILDMSISTALPTAKQVTDFPTKRPTPKPTASKSAKQPTGAPITYGPTRGPSAIASDAAHQSVAQATAEEELMLIDLIDQSVTSMPFTDFRTNRPTSEPIAASPKQLIITSSTYEPTASPSKQSIDNTALHQSMAQAAAAEEELMLIESIESAASMSMIHFPTTRPVSEPSAAIQQATQAAVEEELVLIDSIDQSVASMQSTDFETSTMYSISEETGEEDGVGIALAGDSETTTFPAAEETAPLPTSVPTLGPIVLDGTRGFSTQENKPSTFESLPPAPSSYNGTSYSDEASYLVNYNQYSETPPRRGIIVAIFAGVLVALAAVAALFAPRVKRCREGSNNSEDNGNVFGCADDEGNVEISLEDTSMPRSPNMVAVSDIGTFPGGGSQQRRQPGHQSAPLMSNVSQWIKKSFTSESDATPVASNVTPNNPVWTSSLMDAAIDECDDEESEMRGSSA